MNIGFLYPSGTTLQFSDGDVYNVTVRIGVDLPVDHRYFLPEIRRRIVDQAADVCVTFTTNVVQVRIYFL